MTVHRYPLQRSLADYGLGASGLVMSCALVALAPTALYIVIPFGGLAALFLLFLARTALRQRLSIAADAEEIRMTGAGSRALRWREIDRLTLRYFSTKRNRRDGWMTLTLGAGRQRLTIDSHIEGFDAIARQAAAAAAGRGLALDPTTRGNFAALDIALPGQPA